MIVKHNSLAHVTLACVASALAGIGASFAAPATGQSQVPPAKAPVAAKALAGGAKAGAAYLPASTQNPYIGESPASRAAGFRQTGGSYRLSDSGAALLKAGDVSGARSAFQKALALEPGNPDALYGMARCAGASGDAADQIGYYRRAVYSRPASVFEMAPGGGYRETDVSHLMEFALALDRAGQAGEAVAVYDHAAGLLNYRDADMTGKPHLAALLPDLGDSPGQVPYTPQTLEAMAHAAIGIETPGFDVPELQKAAALAPDSAVVQYYLGRSLLVRDPRAARPAFERAIQLGDEQTAKEAKIYLDMAR